MQVYLLFIPFIFRPSCVTGQDLNTNQFPENFLFGTATSAYQIEGAWNESGKGETLWDHFIHEDPTRIRDHTNADIACDSYHKYEEDVALLKNLGVDFYRFSVSWSRIIPEGFGNKINPDGIRYYNDLINLLLENNITPMVTICHFDIPQPINELGGFENPLFVNWFIEYSRVLFDNFGDKVKLWVTFNEPFYACSAGYGFNIRPSDHNVSTEYMCRRTILKSHAGVYHLYDSVYSSTQKGKISIGLTSAWFEPASNLTADVQAAERLLEFTFALYGDPIFSPTRDYPQAMKEFAGNYSTAEDFPLVPLLGFNEDEINYIKGTCHYFALNHYRTMFVAASATDEIEGSSLLNELQIKFLADTDLEKTSFNNRTVVPWGFRKMLNWIKERYRNPEIIVTENGISNSEVMDDQGRIDYYQEYLSALLDAIHKDKVNVTGYTTWSFMDTFEWWQGYTAKFGLYHVNFSDPNRTRTPKASANYYKQIIKNRRIAAEETSVTQACSNLWLFVVGLIIVVYDCY